MTSTPSRVLFASTLEVLHCCCPNKSHKKKELKPKSTWRYPLACRGLTRHAVHDTLGLFEEHIEFVGVGCHARWLRGLKFVGMTACHTRFDYRSLFDPLDQFHSVVEPVLNLIDVTNIFPGIASEMWLLITQHILKPSVFHTIDTLKTPFLPFDFAKNSTFICYRSVCHLLWWRPVFGVRVWAQIR